MPKSYYFSLFQITWWQKKYIFAIEYAFLYKCTSIQSSEEMFALEKFHCQIRISSREEINMREPFAQDALVHCIKTEYRGIIWDGEIFAARFFFRKEGWGGNLILVFYSVKTLLSLFTTCALRDQCVQLRSIMLKIHNSVDSGPIENRCIKINKQ